jgi:hypothetical protein
MTAACAFCEQPIRSTRAKQFCSDTCKRDFWNGCRLLGFDLFKTGAVDAGVIRMHSRNTASLAVNGSPGADPSPGASGEAH